MNEEQQRLITLHTRIKFPMPEPSLEVLILSSQINHMAGPAILVDYFTKSFVIINVVTIRWASSIPQQF